MKTLFSTLAKYSPVATEDYLTEAFVFLLNEIKERDKNAAVYMLEALTAFPVGDRIGEALITTQSVVIEGRPDIQILIGDDTLIFVEVKHDSKLGDRQLERYQEHLINSGYAQTQLVLLTRSKHSIQETTLSIEKLHHVCWYQISGWLSDLKFSDPVTFYLVDHFIAFLKEKNMSIEKVSWEYIQGVPALGHLTTMMETAIAETLPEESVRRTVGWSWFGFRIGDDDIWFGARYREHLMLVVENEDGRNPTYACKLELEKIHFFSLTAGEQLEVIIKFLSESYSEYKYEK